MQSGGRAQLLRYLGCVAVVGIAAFARAPSAQAGHAPQFRRLGTVVQPDSAAAIQRLLEIDAAPLRALGAGRPSVAAAVPPQIVKILRRNMSPRAGKGATGERVTDPHARPTFTALSRSDQAVLVANAAHLTQLCRWLL